MVGSAVARRGLSSALPRYGVVDDAFEGLLGSLCETSVNAGILARHGKDESHHACVPPEIVAFPTSTAEVSAILRCCDERRGSSWTFAGSKSTAASVAPHPPLGPIRRFAAAALE